MGFIDIQKRIKSLNKESLLKNAINEHTGEAIELNKDQLLHGIGEDGRKLTPQYSNPLYAAKKASQNPLPGFGVPDLILSGDYTDNFEAKIVNNAILRIESKDFKEAFLPGRYPKGQGLTPENKEILQENISKTYVSNWFKIVI